MRFQDIEDSGVYPIPERGAAQPQPNQQSLKNQLRWKLKQHRFGR